MFVLLAAASAPISNAERLKQIPFEFWWKMALGILVFVALVFVLRKVAKMNKFLLGMIVLLAMTFLGFNWIYERNEPSWASPAVSWLAEFFPSKGKK